MPVKEMKELTLFRCVYIALLAALAAYLVSLSPPRDTELLDFSKAWLMNGETLVDTAELNAGDFGGSVVLEKALPDTINYNDRLCLTIANARFTVFIDGTEVYSYDRPENLTGKGYGIAYHTINLSPGQAGRTVRMEIRSVFDNQKGGRVYTPQIGSGGAFLYYLVGRHLLTILFSVGALFLGVLLLLFQPLFPKKQRLRGSMLSLSAVAMIVGLWMTNDTGILRLLTGNVLADRVLDHALLHLVNFPLALLVYSFTREKKTRYVRLVFVLTLLDISAFLVLRYGFDADMAWLTPIMAVYHVACFAVMALMLASDRSYCRTNRIETDLKLFYIAVACFALSALLDFGVYFMGARRMGVRDLFIRFGFAAFIALIVLQTVRWWARERTSIDRDRFINRVLQYAVSAGDPETSINAMLQYIGTELHATRTYIFEPRDEKTWHGTYEWFTEGMEPRAPELLDLPHDGLIDTLYEVFKHQNRLIVPSREQCRKMNPILYQVLTANNVERMAVGPLEANGELIGLLGVDDAPVEYLPEIAEIIRLISYIFAQLVLNREDQKKLVRYSYFDALTGCRNRRALAEFEKQKLDTALPYGVVMCDVNGLKQANDTLGHEAGDAMLLDVSACLAEVFGAENVYRTGGDEFVAYAKERDTAAFDADVERLRALIAEKGRSAALGAVFRESGGADYEKAKIEADTLMYEDKRRYYETHDDRRRR